MSKLDLSLKGFAVGIRFRPNFSIEDQLGKIVDTILYDKKKTFFGPKFFPLVRNLVGRKVLIDEKADNKLTIDNQNLVLEINFAGKKSLPSSDYSKIIKNFDSQLISLKYFRCV